MAIGGALLGRHQGSVCVLQQHSMSAEQLEMRQLAVAHQVNSLEQEDVAEHSWSLQQGAKYRLCMIHHRLVQ